MAKIVAFFAILAIIGISFFIKSFLLTRSKNSDEEDNEIPDVEKDTGFDFGLKNHDGSKPVMPGALFHENDFMSKQLKLDEAYICEVFHDGRPKTAIYRRHNGETAKAKILCCRDGELTLTFDGPKSPKFQRRLVG